MSQIFRLPRQVQITAAGIPVPGSKAYIYLTGTSTLASVWTDKALSISGANPIVADAAGVFPLRWLDESIVYKLTLNTSADVLLYSEDPAFDPTLTQSQIGSILYPRTAAEIAAGVTPTSYSRAPEPMYDLLRIGLVPNSTGARAANSMKLKALLDPAVIGPVGRFLFTNTTGADTYYFDAVSILIRDGCRLDLCHCQLDFAGSFSSANDTYGFFTFIRDVTVENGSINVNYDGTGGTSNGMIFRIGGRTGYNFNGLFSTTGEDTFSRLMGNVTLRNLRLSTNNSVILFGNLLLGGLTNTLIENVSFNGQNVVNFGFWYEFGEYHYEATVANVKTSHAINLKFINCYGFNLKNTGQGAFLQIVGANPCILENIYVDTCFNAVTFSPGEALYYNVGAPFLLAGSSKTRWHTLTNITAQNCASNALGLIGSQSAAGGYLSGSGLTNSQLCDLQGFIINNPVVDDSIYCNGPFILNGGTVRNGGVSGGVIIGQDCLSFEINGTQILDSGNEGVRADTTDTCRSASRNTRGVIRGAKICGSNFGGAGAAGIGLGSCDTVLIQNCQLGYSTLYDNANEATQTFGVTAQASASNVILDNNYCLPASGNAYNKTTGHGGCTILSARGTKTITGDWLWGGPRIAGSIAYSASMTPDHFVANESLITATNGTAFTINAPLNPFHGSISTYTIRNTSGGALGVATWNAAFKMGAAWVQPATGFSRTIEFRYDGANFIEHVRGAADVAN